MFSFFFLPCFQPETGWLHASEGLAMGKGIFYSFPVRYIGSIQVLESLNTLSMDDKTELCRSDKEAEEKIRRKKRR